MEEESNFGDLKGKVIENIYVEKGDKDLLYFETFDKKLYLMCHFQDCCEDVHIEDICGDLLDLVDSPILLAEEVSKRNEDDNCDDSETWTFYKLSTIKGSVTIRWYGTSNGYYSESVDFMDVSDDSFHLERIKDLGN